MPRLETWRVLALMLLGGAREVPLDFRRSDLPSYDFVAILDAVASPKRRVRGHSARALEASLATDSF